MFKISGTFIRMTRGDSFISEVEIYDSTGKPYELQPSDVVTYELKDGDDVIITKVLGSDLILRLRSDETAALAKDVYDYSIHITSDGMKDTFISGTMMLEE